MAVNLSQFNVDNPESVMKAMLHFSLNGSIQDSSLCSLAGWFEILKTFFLVAWLKQCRRTTGIVLSVSWILM